MAFSPTATTSAVKTDGVSNTVACSQRSQYWLSMSWMRLLNLFHVVAQSTIACMTRFMSARTGTLLLLGGPGVPATWNYCALPLLRLEEEVMWLEVGMVEEHWLICIITDGHSVCCGDRHSRWQTTRRSPSPGAWYVSQFFFHRWPLNMLLNCCLCVCWLRGLVFFHCNRHVLNRRHSCHSPRWKSSWGSTCTKLPPIITEVCCLSPMRNIFHFSFCFLKVIARFLFLNAYWTVSGSPIHAGHDGVPNDVCLVNIHLSVCIVSSWDTVQAWIRAAGFPSRVRFAHNICIQGANDVVHSAAY